MERCAHNRRTKILTLAHHYASSQSKSPSPRQCLPTDLGGPGGTSHAHFSLEGSSGPPCPPGSGGSDRTFQIHLGPLGQMGCKTFDLHSLNCKFKKTFCANLVFLPHTSLCITQILYYNKSDFWSSCYPAAAHRGSTPHRLWDVSSEVCAPVEARASGISPAVVRTGTDRATKKISPMIMFSPKFCYLGSLPSSSEVFIF